MSKPKTTQFASRSYCKLVADLLAKEYATAFRESLIKMKSRLREVICQSQ